MGRAGEKKTFDFFETPISIPLPQPYTIYFRGRFPPPPPHSRSQHVASIYRKHRRTVFLWGGVGMGPRRLLCWNLPPSALVQPDDGQLTNETFSWDSEPRAEARNEVRLACIHSAHQQRPAREMGRSFCSSGVPGPPCFHQLAPGYFHPSFHPVVSPTFFHQTPSFI